MVDDLDAVKAFFLELGLEEEGTMDVGGPTVDRLVGLQNINATLVVLRTPDGQGRIELDKFHSPAAIRVGPADASVNGPVNALGIRRIMFTVDSVDERVARMLAPGAELVGEVVQYGDTYRLAYLRGPRSGAAGNARAATRACRSPVFHSTLYMSGLSG